MTEIIHWQKSGDSGVLWEANEQLSRFRIVPGKDDTFVVQIGPQISAVSGFTPKVTEAFPNLEKAKKFAELTEIALLRTVTRELFAEAGNGPGKNGFVVKQGEGGVKEIHHIGGSTVNGAIIPAGKAEPFPTAYSKAEGRITGLEVQLPGSKEKFRITMGNDAAIEGFLSRARDAALDAMQIQSPEFTSGDALRILQRAAARQGVECHSKKGDKNQSISVSVNDNRGGEPMSTVFTGEYQNKSLILQPASEGKIQVNVAVSQGYPAKERIIQSRILSALECIPVFSHICRVQSLGLGEKPYDRHMDLVLHALVAPEEAVAKATDRKSVIELPKVAQFNLQSGAMAAK